MTRPPNLILIVLESVSARWTGLSGGTYATTPNLKAESARGFVFDNVYSPVGRSSNALAAMLMSVYPKLDFREFTEEYAATPQAAATLASLAGRTKASVPTQAIEDFALVVQCRDVRHTAFASFSLRNCLERRPHCEPY